MKSLLAGFCALFCAWVGGITQAARAADPMFDLIISENWPELDRVAYDRLAADPLDGIAIHALARRAIDSEVGSDRLRAEVMQKIDACLAAHPESGKCNLAYGQVFGVLIKSQSMFEAMGSVSKITESFEAAVTADPGDYDARESLVTFYIRAPGIVGGSMRKGYKNVDDYAKLNPDYAKLLYALIALQENDLSKAEGIVGKLPEESGDGIMTHMIAKRWLAIGQAYYENKDNTRAHAALEHARMHGAPSVAAYAHLGLARIAQAEGHPDEAIDEFHAFLAFETPSSKTAEEARASLRQLGTN